MKNSQRDGCEIEHALCATFGQPRDGYRFHAAYTRSNTQRRAPYRVFHRTFELDQGPLSSCTAGTRWSCSHL